MRMRFIVETINRLNGEMAACKVAMPGGNLSAWREGESLCSF